MAPTHEAGSTFDRGPVLAEKTMEKAPSVKREFAAAAAKLPPHIRAGLASLKKWDDLYPVTDEELAAAVKEFESIQMG